MAETSDPPDSASADALAGQLAIEYGPRLRLFAARRLRDTASADDVVQETLRRVLEALRQDRVRDLNAIAGFVFETARNVCMHRGRSAGREGHALERLAGAPELAGSGPGPDPLTALISEQERAAVRVAMSKLDGDDRHLLRMACVESLDSAEIGRKLGVTAGAARVRRHRALQKLAEILNVTKSSDREPRK